MTAENEYPKVDGDILYASEVNSLWWGTAFKTFIESFFSGTEDSQNWTVNEDNGGTSEIEANHLKLVSGTTNLGSSGVTSKGIINTADWNKIVLEYTMNMSASSPDLDTDKSVQCRISDGASVGDGASNYAAIKYGSGNTWIFATYDGTEETTNVTIDFGSEKLIRIELSTTEAKLYVDNVLEATHSTYIPSGTADLKVQLAITNSGTGTTSYTTLFKYCKLWFL